MMGRMDGKDDHPRILYKFITHINDIIVDDGKFKILFISQIKNNEFIF